MALTITFSGDWNSVEGPRRKTRGTLAFDSSYPRGGESLVARDVGLRVIEQITLEPTNGYYFEYDSTNELLKAFQSRSHGILDINTTAVNSANDGSTHLISYTLPASTLSVNGMGVRMRSWGFNTSVANTHSIRSLFGTFIAGTFNLGPSQVGSWNLDTTVYRTAAATQQAIVNFVHTTANVFSSNVTITYPNMTLTSAQTIGTGCSANAANQIVQEGSLIELVVPTGTGTVGVEVESTADLSGLTGVRFEAIGY